MAVRNLKGIERQGRAIAEQKKNEQDMKEQWFWHRVSEIRRNLNDAVDCFDTISALCDHGMEKAFKEWDKNQSIHFSTYRNSFMVRCESDSKNAAYVSYRPKDDAVRFEWSGYGMCETYDTSKTYGMTYFIHTYLKNHGYDDGLTELATGIRAYIDAFFEWVDTI